MEKQVKLDIVQETKYSVPSSRWWEKIVRRAREVLKEKDKISLTIVFVSPLKIRRLNKIWRGKDTAGLILSFPKKQEKFSSILPEKFIGDIFLCPRLIQSEAKKKNIPLRTLYKKLLVHGLLHLYGYSHRLDREWKKMKAMEDKIINNI